MPTKRSMPIYSAIALALAMALALVAPVTACPISVGDFGEQGINQCKSYGNYGPFSCSQCCADLTRSYGNICQNSNTCSVLSEAICNIAVDWWSMDCYSACESLPQQ